MIDLVIFAGNSGRGKSYLQTVNALDKNLQLLEN